MNFEFPREEYLYLKMMCAEKGTSFREFATELMLSAIEDYEDQKLEKKGRKRLKELHPKDTVSFKKAAKLAGWKDDK